MRQRPHSIALLIVLVGTLLPLFLDAQTGSGPYARIAILRPHDGRTVDFEAGYIRHLEWHVRVGDRWVWYGWNITFGDRQRWFVYATFGHSAASLDSPVAPADDERDNVLNVVPHGAFVGNALYEFLPALSRGTGVPAATPRAELTTVELTAGTDKSFEAALAARRSTLQGETHWYRMLAGGGAPRYVRLRPLPSLSAFLEGPPDAPLPDAVNRLIARYTVEILTLRPTMSLGIPSPRE
jgi:hypothetical protein